MAETTQKPKTWGDMQNICVPICIDTYVERAEDDDDGPPNKKSKVDNR